MTEPHASLDAFGMAWRLGATLLFVALNGFFVAAEFALVKVRESRVAELARQGSRPARRVQHILGNLDRYLSACQLGITLSSLVLGALGEPAVSVLIVAAAGGLGIPLDAGAGWLPIVSIGIAFLVITMLHMTVGEQAPKMWALRRPERMALATSLPLHLFAWTFGPFIRAINAISNGLLRLIGLPADLGHESSHSAEEIRSILSLSARHGEISQQQHEIAMNAIRLVDLEVRHILVPRGEIELLSLARGSDDGLERMRTGGHSRFPLCELDLDTVIGIVHTRDVLGVTLLGETPDLRALARAPVFVPDTMAVSAFLRELQETREHCAVVVDEHGTALGLAFREDALEEIVGPLGDEFDSDEPTHVELEDGSFELSGRMSIPEAEGLLDLEISDDEGEEEETIGGHVTARFGRIPLKGDQVRVGRYLATVIVASPRRVRRLRLELVGDDDAGAAANGETTRSGAREPLAGNE